MFKLIDVVRLERRVQSLENTVTMALKLNELNSLRLEMQLNRIIELENLTSALNNRGREH